MLYKAAGEIKVNLGGRVLEAADIGLLTARELLEVKYDDALVGLSEAIKMDDSSMVRHWEAYIREIEASMSRLDTVPAES